MKLFLTSNPFMPDGSINEENDFLWNIKFSLPYETNALFVASTYNDALPNDREATKIKDAFNSKGIFFRHMDVLDYRTASMTKEEIAAHNLIILSDGKVPLQNDFIRITGLKQKLEGYNGTVLSIGTGSMNVSEEAYIIPESESEILNGDLTRFRGGLGLTKTQIIPNYEETMAANLNGFAVRDRILSDSRGRKFLGLPDGSYLMSTDGVELIYGAHYKIEDRNITRIDAGFMAKAFA